MTAHNYDPRLVTVSINATPLGGLNTDVFASIAYAGDVASAKRDISGNPIFQHDFGQELATVTLTLQANSVGNAILTAQYQAMKRTPGGGAFALTITDNNFGNGVSLFSCAFCKVVKMPDREYGVEAPTLTWPIIAANPFHVEAALPSVSIF